MPYIPSFKREHVDKYIDGLVKAIIDSSGPDNIDKGIVEYAIFKLVHQLSDGILVKESRRFDNMNALVGVLETTKAEFIARVLKPYEDLKLIDSWISNGKDKIKE